MFGLAMGVSRISTTLPGPVYALLSGLNAATVGIIALAGVQLANKAISGPLTRLLVVGTGCAGLCYNALWYLPVILFIDGMISLSWSLWSSSTVREKIIERSRRRLNRRAGAVRGLEDPVEDSNPQATDIPELVRTGSETLPLPSHQLENPLQDLNSTAANPNQSSSAEGTDMRASHQLPNLRLMSVKGSVALAAASSV